MAKIQSYTGAIELISGVRPKNGKDFPMMDAHDVQTREDGTRLDAELDLLHQLDSNLDEIITSKDEATENTKIAIGEADQILEIPTMEEFNAVKNEIVAPHSEETENTKISYEVGTEEVEIPTMKELEGVENEVEQLKNDFKNSVCFTQQVLTSDQQAQARGNIGAADLESVNGLKDDVVQLAEDMTGKLSEPTDGLAVGKYFRVAALDENGHAVLEAVDAKDVGVQDVQLAGESVVADGVANVPLANGFGVTGVVNLSPSGGIKWSGNLNALSIDYASQAAIAARSSSNNPLIPYYLDYAVKAAMCDGKGAAWTDAERISALLRLGCTVDYNGFVKWTAQEVAE